MTKIEKRYINQDEIKRYCLNIVSMMFKDDFKPDIIVGVTRGGLWPAMMLSHYLDIKMYTLDVRLRDGDTKENATFLKTQMVKGKKILIVDDINDSGATFKWIAQDWEVDNDSEKSNVKFAALIDNIPSEFIVEYSGIEINKEENPEWIVFPYEEWW
jgi:hypoxanthine phosphoribosyltransferase